MYMKKHWIFALIPLAALSCSKRSSVRAPWEPERVTFSATVNNLIEIAPKASSPVPQSTKLGVYAFQGENLPGDNNNNAADNALWSGASNIPYAWNANSFVQSSGETLYWEQTIPLSFASYFPYQSSGITDYLLKVDMADQSSAPDYGSRGPNWRELRHRRMPRPCRSTIKLPKSPLRLSGTAPRLEQTDSKPPISNRSGSIRLLQQGCTKLSASIC